SSRSLLDRHLVDPTLVVVFGALAAGVSVMRKASTNETGLRPLLPALAVTLAAAMLTLGIRRPASFYRDRTNDAFFATAAAETQAVVLTAGSYQLVQLYTRRPVLIDGGGLDTVTYAPDTGPAMERILRDVYDLDYFNPPSWAKGSSLLPHDYVKRVWA